ncbi:MAG: hypothetical protein GY861_03865 [bacterium]|nr:hypothetical protein [bacterium]
MKHTPKPWNIDYGNCHVGGIATVYGLPGERKMLSPDKRWAEIWAPHSIDGKTQKANLDLIVAAPDLLEALKEMIIATDWENPPKRGNAIYLDAVARPAALKAIKKAEES